jgi:arylsulfatase A-like enzyme
MSDEKRPNILFLMTDQHRWDALGCVNPLVQTPNLDALAARGVRFSQAICNAPMCIPSRYSLMLGLYPSQSGVRHNTNMCPTDDDLPLPVLAQRLKAAGYQTAGIGKVHWYVGNSIAPDIPTQPSRRGFEFRAQARGYESGEVEPGSRVIQDDLPEAFAKLHEERQPFGGGGETIVGYTGITSQVPPEQHLEGWLTKQAIDFLENERDATRPFFLYISYDFPHPGYNVPPGYEERYDLADIPERNKPPWEAHQSGHSIFTRFPEEWEAKTPAERRRTTLRYYALCTYVDDLFGQVLRKLDEINELQNTFIIFLSDHGEMLGDRFHRFSKYSFYEGSLRVPLILAGAGVPVEEHGAVDSRSAALLDVLPTVLRIAREPIPACLPGYDLLSDKMRLGSFSEMHGSGYEPHQQAATYMWRSKNWKLILDLPGEAIDVDLRLADAQGELYDLRHDPEEWSNIYHNPDYLEIRESMTRDMLLHLASVWAKYPVRAHQESGLQPGAGGIQLPPF